MQSVGNFVTALWRRWSAQHPVARTMALNWALGAGVAFIGAALVFALDPFGLRSWLWRSDLALSDVAMLCAAFAFTCGGLAGAAAIMRIDENRDQPRGRRRSQRVGQALAARAPRRG